MTYSELIEKVLAGKTLNRAAKEMGIAQSALHGYLQGDRIPGPQSIMLMADRAGVSVEEVVKTFAKKEAAKKPRESFVKKFLTGDANVSYENLNQPGHTLNVMSNRRRNWRLRMLFDSLLSALNTQGAITLGGATTT